MKVTVKLFAYLRKGRFKSGELELPEGASIMQVLNMLAINADELKIGTVLLNGRHADFATVLKERDILAIFPPVAGG